MPLAHDWEHRLYHSFRFERKDILREEAMDRTSAGVYFVSVEGSKRWKTSHGIQGDRKYRHKLARLRVQEKEVETRSRVLFALINRRWPFYLQVDGSRRKEKGRERESGH